MRSHWPKETLNHGKEVLKKAYVLLVRVEKAEQGETTEDYKQCPYDTSLECDIKARNRFEEYGYDEAEFKDLWYTVADDFFYAKYYSDGSELLRRIYNKQTYKM